jgi:hypothetical protein
MTTNEKERADAHATLRAQYWAHVRMLAEDCHRAVARGEVATQEDLRRYAEESVDSSRYTFVRGLQLETLRYTEHNDAAWLSCLRDCETFGELFVGTLAHWALLRDVLAHDEYRQAENLLRDK